MARNKKKYPFNTSSRLECIPMQGFQHCGPGLLQVLKIVIIIVKIDAILLLFGESLFHVEQRFSASSISGLLSNDTEKLINKFRYIVARCMAQRGLVTIFVEWRVISHTTGEVLFLLTHWIDSKCRALKSMANML